MTLPPYRPMKLPQTDNVLAMIEPHRNTIVQVAQGVIDDWDWNLGGCCGAIADEICNTLDELEGLAAYPHGQDGGEHTWVVLPTKQGIVEVDIPWQIYETRLGYCRYEPTKMKVCPNDLVVEFVDVDPNEALDGDWNY